MEEQRLRAFERRVLKRYWELSGRKWREPGEES
jgi:hypothetical protein